MWVCVAHYVCRCCVQMLCADVVHRCCVQKLGADVVCRCCLNMLCREMCVLILPADVTLKNCVQVCGHEIVSHLKCHEDNRRHENTLKFLQSIQIKTKFYRNVSESRNDKKVILKTIQISVFCTNKKRILTSHPYFSLFGSSHLV